VELYLHSTIRLQGVVLGLKKHRDNFTFCPYGSRTHFMNEKMHTKFVVEDSGEDVKTIIKWILET
jgi:hypothetical protein